MSDATTLPFLVLHNNRAIPASADAGTRYEMPFTPPTGYTIVSVGLDATDVESRNGELHLMSHGMAGIDGPQGGGAWVISFRLDTPPASDAVVTFYAHMIPNHGSIGYVAVTYPYSVA